MGRDGEFWGDAKSREARLATPHRFHINPALIFAIFTFSRFISTFPRSESNPCFRFHRGVPCCYHPHCIKGGSTSRGWYCQHPSTPRGPCSARENSPFVVSGTWPVDTSLPRRRQNKGEGERARSVASSRSPMSWVKHSQVAERRARIYPPIPAFPLWGRGQRAGRVNSRRAFTHPCPIL
jgi:hypothetical protein